MDQQKIAELIARSRQKSGGKIIKYSLLDSYKEEIRTLLENNVSLPIILEWLSEDKQMEVALNTLRKFVTRTYGDQYYEEYLKRNGWAKNKTQGKTRTTLAEPKNMETEKLKKPSEGVTDHQRSISKPIPTKSYKALIAKEKEGKQ